MATTESITNADFEDDPVEIIEPDQERYVRAAGDVLRVATAGAVFLITLLAAAILRSVISGGYSNQIRGFDSTNAAAVARDITDGTSNTLLLGETVGNATIGGGYANTIGANCVAAIICGGQWNLLGDGSVRGFIGGGVLNNITDGTANTIIAGERNRISGGSYSTIGGGFGNTNSGAYSVVPGGWRNSALGDYSYASGRRARANHPGTFVWADAQDADFNSTSNNQFNVRADGSVRFVTSGAGMTLDGQPVLAGSVGPGQLTGTYSNAVTFNNGANSFNGVHTGNGAGLTSLNASQLASGTVPDARLSANASLLGPSIESAEITDGTIANADISPSAAIADTKLATLSTAGKVANSALSSSVTLLGQTIESAEITDGTIAAADVNAPSFNSTFWRAAGNAGTTAGAHFLGTTDNQPLEFKVNGLRALRLEDNGDSASDSGTTPDGAPNLIAGSPRNFVGTGVVGATIAGGGATNYGGAAYINSVLSDFGVVGGGLQNTIANAFSATIAGGFRNDIGTNSDSSAIGGGGNNNIAADSGGATIAGGAANDIGTNAGYSAIGGGDNNNIAANSYYATIAGGLNNDIGTNSDSSAIGGGNDNNIAADSAYATIAGGVFNDIGTNSDSSAIGGGTNNNIGANSPFSTIAGGALNDIGINSDSSVIAGGNDNNIADNSFSSAIGGGRTNTIGINSDYSVIAGGYFNALGDGALFATIPGGRENAATDYAFAAGRQAKADHQGAFVWGDSTAGDIASTVNNSVTMRASGGYRLFSNSGATLGVSLAANGIAWGVLSDRNAKKNFQPVDGQAVLEKLAQMPLQKWNYKVEADDSVPHIGPMAQDFKEAFYPGRDDKTISTLEFDGVELAAIQGLNQKVEHLNSELKRRDAENAELKQRLEALEKIIRNQKSN